MPSRQSRLRARGRGTRCLQACFRGHCSPEASLGANKFPGSLTRQTHKSTAFGKRESVENAMFSCTSALSNFTFRHMQTETSTLTKHCKYHVRLPFLPTHGGQTASPNPGNRGILVEWHHLPASATSSLDVAASQVTCLHLSTTARFHI